MKGRDPRLVGNWVSQELVGALSREGLSWEAGGKEKVSRVELGEVLDLFGEEKISGESFFVSWHHYPLRMRPEPVSRKLPS